MSSPNYGVTVSKLSARGVVLSVKWLQDGPPEHEYGANLLLQFLMDPYRDILNGRRLISRSDEPEERICAMSPERLGYVKHLLWLSSWIDVPAGAGDPKRIRTIPGKGRFYGTRRVLKRSRDGSLSLESDYTRFCKEASRVLYLLDVSRSNDEGVAEYTAFVRYEELLYALEEGMWWETSAFDFSSWMIW